MDESTSRLSPQELSTLQRMEQDLAREDPWFAASISGPTARQYTWPRVFRLRARSYAVAGVGLMVLAALVHQPFTLVAALTCFGAAVVRTLRDS